MSHPTATMKQLILIMFCVSLSSSLYSVSANYPSSDEIYLSFSLTHRDAESSALRSAEADPADLPEDMPMRAVVAAGRALSARLDMQRKLLTTANPPRLNGRLSYGGEAVGDFFLTVPVGRPSQNLIFLVDTGSEFSWVQCSPCLNCTDTTAPRFAYTKSSSFLAVGCDSLLCRSSVALNRLPSTCDSTTAVAQQALCRFGLEYGDGSLDLGFYSVDSFDLGPQFSKPFVFGCGTTVQETVVTPSSGLMGLDAAPYSFTSQLFSSSPGMPKKFAYCLPDRFKSLNASGRIEFGNYKQPSGMKYTPFAPPYSPLWSVYYYVELQGITVGETLIKVDKVQEAEKIRGWGTVFDSGNAVTHLVKPLYDKLVAEMTRQTAHLRPFDASNILGFDLCYKVPATAKAPPQVPRMSLHFAQGVDLELGPESILLGAGTDKANIYFCLAFSSALNSLPGLNIIGNYQQQNYWVEYNLDTSHLGLAQANCNY